MKFIKVLVLALLFVYFLPLEAFCHEGKDVKGQVHCALCHAVSPQIVIVHISTFISTVSFIQTILPQIKLSYQNPSLETLKRPPVVSV